MNYFTKPIKLSLLSLLSVLINSGCVVFLSTVAAVTIYFSADDDEVTAEAALGKPADVVYAALIDEVNKDKELVLDSENIEEKKIIILRKERKATCTVLATDDEKSRLMVVADAGTDKEADDYQIALNVVTRVCKSLEIEYELVEKEPEE